jgi:hypothetical protein
MLPHILKLETRARRMVTFTPRLLHLRYVLVRRLSGLRAGLEVVEKRRNYCPCWESNLDSTVVQPVI